MKKYVSLLFALFIMVLSYATLTSCSGSDSDSPIVGTWYCDDHYVGGTDTYVFKSNGSYEWRCPGQPGKEYDSGHYSYEPQTGVLIVTNEKGTIWYYRAVNVTSSSFTLIDEDGYRYSYHKR